ncbi:MAG TPA: hypothetical protein ENJ09_11690 [Planctomycetes bacterium]|nr:hypothetical protein [Planctomycetota bacterium]
MSRAASWFLLVVWSAWLFALQGLVASTPELADWTPELGVVLLLALDPRLDRSDALLALLIVSAGAIAFSSDPPLAILAGYGAVVFVARSLRSIVEIDQPIARALLAGVSAAVLVSYFDLSRSALLASEGLGPVAGGIGGARVFHAALGTALVTLVAAPLVLRLPGMGPLRGGRR